MRKIDPARGVVRFAALAAVAFLVALPGSASASQPAANPTAASFEQSFLSETIDHHFMGVKMGRLCMDKAVSNRLGDICTAIVATQSGEIARMRDQFLLDWYGVEKHPELTRADRADLAELRGRRGNRFDRAVSRMFIEHHEMQIASSQTCLDQAEHHELIHTCMDQIETQSAEIKQFRKVLRASR
jgi:uncharacterized protein (DUF305 family)